MDPSLWRLIWMRRPLVLLTVALAFPIGIGCASKPPEQRVRIAHFNGKVIDFVKLLWNEHNVPVSIVEDPRDPGIELDRVNEPPADFLRSVRGRDSRSAGRSRCCRIRGCPPRPRG